MRRTCVQSSSLKPEACTNLPQRAKSDLTSRLNSAAEHPVGSNDNFGIIGAYPEGRDFDICRGRKGERPKADERIADVPMPKADPIYGADGPLFRLWAS